LLLREMDPTQLEAWQAVTLVLARLPTALEAQLQCDAAAELHRVLRACRPVRAAQSRDADE